MKDKDFRALPKRVREQFERIENREVDADDRIFPLLESLTKAKERQRSAQGSFSELRKILDSIPGQVDAAKLELSEIDAKRPALIFRWLHVVRNCLRYYNKNKAPRWLRAVGLQLPEANTIKRLNPNVVTDADIVKPGIDPTMTVGDARGWRFNAGNDKTYAAAYNDRTNAVALFRVGAAERNALHESCMPRR